MTTDNANKPKRRRLQWSMATMFIGVTIFCIWFGLLSRRAENQKRAVEALHTVKGLAIVILYDYEVRTISDGSSERIPEADVSPPGPAWLLDLIGVDYLANVAHVEFLRAHVRDDDLRRLRDFRELESLYLLECDGITDVGLKHLTSLMSLTELSLLRNQLTKLPPEIANLTNLKVLRLSDNHIKTVPPEIGDLTNLRWLSVSDNKLMTLPPAIGKLTNLEVLRVESNQLTTVPPEIGRLTKLRELWLYDNKITKLPAEFWDLTELEELSMGGNQLTVLPPEIGKLTRLESLRLYDNEISTLPAELWKITKLNELNLVSNKLTKLPAEIGKLTDLEYLIVGGNQFTALPAEIGNLKKLVSLDLGEIPITDADLGPLKLLKNLDQIGLYGTNVTKAGISDLQQALPNCEIFTDF